MRISIPQARRHWVERPRLLDMLLDWRDLGLIQIVARAGYGKTTLAGMLLHSLAAQPVEKQPAAAWEAALANAKEAPAVRARLGRGEPCAHLVPRDVLAYVAEHGLYRAGPAVRTSAS